MLARAQKIRTLVDKVILGYAPRYVAGKDLMEVCVERLRALAVMAYVNNETGKIINHLVDMSDEVERIAQDPNTPYEPARLGACDGATYGFLFNGVIE